MCYHPDLGRCGDVMGQTDVGAPGHLDVFHTITRANSFKEHTHPYLYTHTWTSPIGSISQENIA